MPDDKEINSNDNLPLKKLFETVWDSLRYLYRSNPKVFIAIVILALISNLTPVAYTYLMSLLLDEIIHLATDVKSFSSHFFLILGSGIGLSIFIDLTSKLMTALEWKFQREFDINIKKQIAEKKFVLDIPLLDDPSFNDTINRAERYSYDISRLYNNVLFYFEQLIRLISTFIILISFSPIMFVIAFISVIPTTLISMSTAKKDWQIDKDYEEKRRFADNNIFYTQSVFRIKEVRVLGIGPYLLDKGIKGIIEIFKERYRVYIKGQKLEALAYVLHLTGSAINLLIIVTEVIHGNISVGKFTFYRDILGRAENAVKTLLNRSVTIYEVALRVRFSLNFLNSKNNMVDGDEVLSVDSKPPRIEFKNIWFKYPNQSKYIFKDFNLVITPGTNLAVVGENGAGKTTFINLLLRFYDPEKGEILINGINLKSLDRKSYYRQISTLFQDFHNYHFSVYENIGVGNLNKIDDKKAIIQAAKAMGADDFIREYPNGYDNLLDKSFKGGIEPSVGQHQKIALSRAIFRNSSILVLDEPTSAIDPKAEFEIFEKLLSFVKEKTMIIISHRFSTVRNADRIIVLEKGKIIEDGTHNQLMELENGVYKHAFNLQKKGYE